MGLDRELHSASLEIDSALGGGWDHVGELIRQHGKEDSSGLRRLLGSSIAENNYALFSRLLPVSGEEFRQLRHELTQ